MSLPSVPMTEQRLWELYCVVGFSYREISELTGWKWDELKQGIRKWNLAWTHARHIDTDVAIRTGLAEVFHVHVYSQPIAPLTMNKTPRLVVDVNALVKESRSALQDRVFVGAVG